VVSILTTDEDKLLIPLVLELILPLKLFNLSSTSTPFTIIVVAVIDPLATFIFLPLRSFYDGEL
jgi:hypothetical protein